MPLQNRVDPSGRIIRTPARGGWMGNRGILHDDGKNLGTRRWAHKAWICCHLEFRGRQREVMAPRRYTELFFLDEATALAAGHRPCYECRRADYRRFMECWARGQGADDSAPPPRAGTVDALLHRERVARTQEKVTYTAALETLPDGAFVLSNSGDAGAWLVRGDLLWRWDASGYGERRSRGSGPIAVLTPRSIVGAIRAGYRPQVAAE